GFGDLLQFARYLPLLRRRGARVVLECRPPLRPLLEGWVGANALVAPGEAVAADLFVPLMSLPGRLGAGYESGMFYLPLPPPACWPAHIEDSGRRVGLVWTGRQTAGNERRSCPPSALAPLLAVPGMRFHSLQVGADGNAVEAMGMRDLGRYIRNFRDLAGLMMQMDVVLTIDSAPAHLGGGMGLPVWTMLPWGADWRWLDGREDSPWYPGMRLFRQPRPGDWAAVVEAVAGALRDMP
ncbi:MAG: hypothetical protein K2Q10_13050, partial [Rhodospirillales bacterium]|nr:hypothetical protein [Rhodospirillales bacterium]